eukprot:222690-Pyramimonas_sp.AAC.1
MTLVVTNGQAVAVHYRRLSTRIASEQLSAEPDQHTIKPRLLGLCQDEGGEARQKAHPARRPRIPHE